MECMFKGKSLCFTGTMRELTRTQAEKEARSRGAQTQNVVNEELDYLVVGEIPSRGWAFGNYGRKIEKAEDLKQRGSIKPFIIPESVYMEALGQHPPNNAGDIDAKMIVVNMNFLSTPQAKVDRIRFEKSLSLIKGKYDCHVNANSMPAEYYNKFIYDESCPIFPPSSLAIKCRIVRQEHLVDNSIDFIEEVKSIFSNITCAYSTFKWFEKKEGSADYVRLIKELPENLKIESL